MLTALMLLLTCFHCGYEGQTVAPAYGHPLCAACVSEVERDLEAVAKKHGVSAAALAALAEANAEGRIPQHRDLPGSTNFHE
jgi:hypothetical protein